MPPAGFVPGLTVPPEVTEAVWFVVRGNDVLVPDEPGLVTDPVALGVPVADPVVLGVLGSSTGCWAVEVGEDTEAPHGHRFVGLRSLYGPLDEQLWNVAGRAVQLVDWQRTHRYCGRCGGPMERATEDRAMRCPRDEHRAYPRLAPAVIVLVERDGRALLARSGRWDVPMYSTLAGFVEPGETLEETVHREIHEEVGVEVDELRYVASQAWPFPHSLMLGFTAQWTGGDITVDGDEIADAAWFDPQDLPLIPPPMSIARRLIDDWVRRAGG